MPENFKAGDIVTLKSGGPKMTLRYEGVTGEWVVQWFVGTDLKQGTFAPDSLIIADGKPALKSTATQAKGTDYTL